ncbi:MAG: DUF4157 domain-containing protein [Acidobacteriaceae bacterium]
MRIHESVAQPWIQPGIRLGAVHDPCETEADRAANAAVIASEASGQAHGSASGAAIELPAPSAQHAAAATPFRGNGAPLPDATRTFFERRFDYNFADVRVHHGPDAAASAHALGAHAYTLGRNIVFGADEYSPQTTAGKKLLAHELTHVVQQRAGQTMVQRSPLSDSVRDAWKAEPKIEALLARLSQPDVQKAQADADVDTELASILKTQPDDLFVAQRIRKGQLGQTTGKFGPKVGGKPVQRPVEATFIRGATDRRALVIAGVHGTERQGMEVARDLIRDLQAAAQPPGFTTVIVPSLFPDNAASRSRESGPTPTNRNFPLPSEDLAAARAAGGGTAVDASKDAAGHRTREILPENLMLLELIERFHPERIISIHGTWGPGEAGAFYDPRKLRPDEVKAARDWARGNAYMRMTPDQQEEPGGQEKLQELEERLFRQRLGDMTAQASQTDRDLALQTAQKIDTDTAGIGGRGARDVKREGEKPATTAAHAKDRHAHPSISGNVGDKGAIDNSTWPGGVPGGVSLGGYAPQRGISVFTVEPPVNANTADYPTAADKVSQADRKIELQAYADAVRTIMLAAP